MEPGCPGNTLLLHHALTLQKQIPAVVERTRAGLAAAREEGRIGGRRSKLTDEQWAQAGRLVAAGESRQRVALIYDVGISTLYKKFPATR